MKPIEEIFIDFVIDRGCETTTFLTNGVKLNGRISLQSDKSLTLYRDGITQLVMKHAVATVMPQDAFNLSEVLEYGGQ